MADRQFRIKPEGYLRLFSLLNEMGWYFMNAELCKDKDDVFKQPRVAGVDDIPESFHWYGFSDDFTKEMLPIRPIDNIHMGRVYAPASAFGGPFMDFWGRYRSPNHFVTINVGYMSQYWISSGAIKPPDALKAHYRQICRFLKVHELKE